jgi:hypothetical protein
MLYQDDSESRSPASMLIQQNEIPRDIKTDILTKLPVRDVFSYCSTSKLENVCKDEKFWRYYIASNMSDEIYQHIKDIAGITGIKEIIDYIQKNYVPATEINALIRKSLPRLRFIEKIFELVKVAIFVKQSRVVPITMRSQDGTPMTIKNMLISGYTRIGHVFEHGDNSCKLSWFQIGDIVFMRGNKCFDVRDIVSQNSHHIGRRVRTHYDTIRYKCPRTLNDNMIDFFDVDLSDSLHPTNSGQKDILTANIYKEPLINVITSIELSDCDGNYEPSLLSRMKETYKITSTNYALWSILQKYSKNTHRPVGRINNIKDFYSWKPIQILEFCYKEGLLSFCLMNEFWEGYVENNFDIQDLLRYILKDDPEWIKNNDKPTVRNVMQYFYEWYLNGTNLEEIIQNLPFDKDIEYDDVSPEKILYYSKNMPESAQVALYLDNCKYISMILRSEEGVPLLKYDKIVSAYTYINYLFPDEDSWIHLGDYVLTYRRQSTTDNPFTLDDIVISNLWTNEIIPFEIIPLKTADYEERLSEISYLHHTLGELYVRGQPLINFITSIEVSYSDTPYYPQLKLIRKVRDDYYIVQ